jgi:hypothetical protein
MAPSTRGAAKMAAAPQKAKKRTSGRGKLMWVSWRPLECVLHY